MRLMTIGLFIRTNGFYFRIEEMIQFQGSFLRLCTQSIARRIVRDKPIGIDRSFNTDSTGFDVISMCGHVVHTATNG